MDNTPENLALPRSIGIIMDGNRRWAKEQGLPTFEGHRAGYEKLRDVVDWSKEIGIANVTAYAFSTENWNRAQEEVTYLMGLFRLIIRSIVTEAIAKDVRVVFLGERDRFESDIAEAMSDAEAKTRGGTSLTLGIALSYGGRSEIVDAIHRIPKEKLATISEEEFSALLWSNEIPDPDLIIRTSGEMRLSNFLPWQSVYSELAFTTTYWPALTKEEFRHIISEYASRERRRGK